VYAEATGFRPVLSKEVVLTVGQRAELSFRLEVNPVMEAIEILSKTQLLEARRTSVATTIVERLIKELPSSTRDAFGFTLLDSAATRENQASLPPVPVTGLNLEGQQARANMVTIDGVDAIDNTINGVRITVPQDAVQEFQILKSGYTEHGRSSAAVINIVSRQGGARIQGDLFGLLRSRHVSATHPFACEPDPGDTNTQAGFTLGGPLRKQKTFFFVGFDTTQENSTGISAIGRNNYEFVEIQNPYGLGAVLVTSEQAQFIRSAPANLAGPYLMVADRSARTALFGNSPGGPQTFGLFPNPLPASYRGLTSEAGNYKTTQDAYVHSSRLDQTFGTHGLFVRVGSYSSDTLGRSSNSQTQPDTQNAFSRTNDLWVRDLSVTVQLSSSFSSAWLNEARFQFGRRGAGPQGKQQLGRGGDSRSRLDRHRAVRSGRSSREALADQQQPISAARRSHLQGGSGLQHHSRHGDFPPEPSGPVQLSHNLVGGVSYDQRCARTTAGCGSEGQWSA
jgi:hypothetical protein